MIDAEIAGMIRELRANERAEREAQRAYEDGQLAYCLGQPLDANPRQRYRPQWARGWHDAQVAALEHQERNAAPLTAAERERGLAAIAAIRASLGLIPQSS